MQSYRYIRAGIQILHYFHGPRGSGTFDSYKSNVDKTKRELPHLWLNILPARLGENTVPGSLMAAPTTPAVRWSTCRRRVGVTAALTNNK